MRSCRRKCALMYERVGGLGVYQCVSVCVGGCRRTWRRRAGAAGQVQQGDGAGHASLAPTHAAHWRGVRAKKQRMVCEEATSCESSHKPPHSTESL